MLVVPPLPDKQYSGTLIIISLLLFMWDVAIGRYGEEFIEKRREKLEIWLNRVARHPVISQCAVLDHFLTSGDSEKAKEREKFIKISDLLCKFRSGRPEKEKRKRIL